jgi:jumonji domain-containing protein 7
MSSHVTGDDAASRPLSASVVDEFASMPAAPTTTPLPSMGAGASPVQEPAGAIGAIPAESLSLHPSSDPPDPLSELISTFYELNGAAVEEIPGEPSPLEFMRFVARNTPFVARGAAAGWSAVEMWDREFLLSAMRGERVNVAVTPRG